MLLGGPCGEAPWGKSPGVIYDLIFVLGVSPPMSLASGSLGPSSDDAESEKAATLPRLSALFYILCDPVKKTASAAAGTT